MPKKCLCSSCEGGVKRRSFTSIGVQCNLAALKPVETEEPIVGLHYESCAECGGQGVVAYLPDAMTDPYTQPEQPRPRQTTTDEWTAGAQKRAWAQITEGAEPAAEDESDSVGEEPVANEQDQGGGKKRKAVDENVPVKVEPPSDDGTPTAGQPLAALEGAVENTAVPVKAEPRCRRQHVSGDGSDAGAYGSRIGGVPRGGEDGGADSRAAGGEWRVASRPLGRSPREAVQSSILRPSDLHDGGQHQ